MDLFEFSCDLKEIEYTPEDITNFLPPWKTKIIEAIKLDDDTSALKLKLLINAKTIESVKSWIKEYQDRTLCTYYIRDTPSCKGRYLLFKQRLHCHHNTKTWNLTDSLNVKRKRRNTNCPSFMKITLHSPVKINKRYVRKHIPDAEMPCEIILVPTHNHEINNAEALSWRRVSTEVKQKLLDLYDRGHNASTAREIIKLDIYTKDNFMNILSDRKFCPDYNYCYNLYRKYMKNKPKNISIENFNADDLQQILIKRLEEYNDATNEDSCRFFKYGDSVKNYVICICPPMLRRVHEHIRACTDVVFLDSIKSNKSQKNQDKSRLYILLTPSECGGLPLGVLITSEDNSDALCNGFEILKDMLGEKLFCGKTDGPKIFITDDNVVEKDAVKKSWPNSINLLCIYHVLQSVFNWLVKIKNSIGKLEQQLFFQDFRAIMFAKTKNECLEKYNEAKVNAKGFANYLKLLDEYWNRKNLWALSYRSYFLSEAALRLLKEQIFERIKSFNTLQTLDFILTKFMSYYEKKLLDAVQTNQIHYFQDTEYDLPPEHVSKRIQNLGNKLFLVPCDEQENLFFVVNTDILSCSCTSSNNGENCKHIEWLLAIQPSNKTIQLVDDNTMRSTFYFIATGEEIRSAEKNIKKDEKSNDIFKNVEDNFNENEEILLKDHCVYKKNTVVNKSKKVGNFKQKEKKILPKINSEVKCLFVVTKNEQLELQPVVNNMIKIENNDVKISDNKESLTEKQKELLQKIQSNLKKILESSHELNSFEKFNEKLEKMKHSEVIKALSTFGSKNQKRKLVTVQSISRKKRRKFSIRS